LRLLRFNFEKKHILKKDDYKIYSLPVYCLDKKNIKVNGSLTHDVLKSMKGLDFGMLSLRHFIDECDMGFSNEDKQKKKEIKRPITTIQRG